VIDGAALLAALLTGAVTAAVVARFVPPTRALAGRVRPYTTASRTSLGRAPDVGPLADPGPLLSGSTLRRVLGPMVLPHLLRLGRLLDRTGDEALALRLRQAGLLSDVPEQLRPQEYRLRQVGAAATTTAVFTGAALVLGLSPGLTLLVAVLGFVSGVSRWRGKVDRAIAERRLRLQIELYTVNQLLALHIRCGGGVVQAMQHIVERGRGAVVEELAEVLRAHRSGRRVTEALERAARTTPEPHAARTYKLLANGVEYGADLADGLRALSDDIREQRAEAFKRAATKRRAAMLVPIIAILAPVMLLFVAAPLPSIVFGAR